LIIQIINIIIYILYIIDNKYIRPTCRKHEHEHIYTLKLLQAGNLKPYTTNTSSTSYSIPEFLPYYSGLYPQCYNIL